MTAPTRPFGQTRDTILHDPQAAALYLEEFVAAGDTGAFKLAVGNVVEAQGGIPTLETLTKILGTLGMRVAVRVEGAALKPPSRAQP